MSAASVAARVTRDSVRLTERVVGRTSKVGDEAYLDHARFPWAASVEAEWPAIRRELDEILLDRATIPNFQDVSRSQAKLTDDDRWKTFFLYGYGYRADHNCERCPVTARVVESIPGMTTAFFSILEGGKRIPPHRGPYKGVLRYHLGVRIPGDGGACGLRVDGETRRWQEGAGIVFDDTYEHEAWNESAEPRVVLFVDFKRPLPRPVTWLNDGVLSLIKRSPFVTDAIKNLESGAARVDDAAAAG